MDKWITPLSLYREAASLALRGAVSGAMERYPKTAPLRQAELRSRLTRVFVDSEELNGRLLPVRRICPIFVRGGVILLNPEKTNPPSPGLLLWIR
jgi:hypothetical protein